VSLIVQQVATIYSLFISVTALHVSGGIFTHHQDLIALYLQYLALMRPLLVPVMNVTGWELHSLSRQVSVTVSLMPDTVDTVLWGPDDGWRYHPRHVADTRINKLYIVASCWIIIDTYYTMHGPMNIKANYTIYTSSKLQRKEICNKLLLKILPKDISNELRNGFQSLREIPMNLFLTTVTSWSVSIPQP